MAPLGWYGRRGRKPKPGSRSYSYAITSALILSPLLWEVTVRFRMIEPGVAAAVLAAFALLAMILAWRRNLSLVIWVGMLTAVVTALILMAATRAPVPFTLALLVMALLSEFAAGSGRWPALRPVVAAAADFATVILIIILGNSGAIPSEYQPVAAGVMIALVAALFAIYAVSLAIRSLIFRLKINGFEAAQLAATVLLAGWAMLRIEHEAGVLALGAFLPHCRSRVLFRLVRPARHDTASAPTSASTRPGELPS